MGVLPDWAIKRDIKIEPFSPAQKREGVISYGVTSYGYDVRLGYKLKIFSPINATIIDPKCFDPKALVDIDLTPKHEWIVTGNGPSQHYSCRICSQLAKVSDSDRGPKECIHRESFVLIPPHSFALGESFETFTIPRDVLCIVLGKSTYARTGLIINVTPGEPEWTGKWTIEMSNTTPLPIKVYVGEGIMQAIFLRTDGYSEALLKSHGQLAATVAGDNAEGILKCLHRWLGPEGIKQVMTLWVHGDATCEQSYADKKGKYQSQSGLTLPKVDGDNK